MLTRIVENLLMGAFNRAQDRREVQPPPPEPVPEVAPPADFAVLGHLIPTNGASGREPVALSSEARRRHLYMLGATGTGKTNLLLRLIESDIQNGQAFCVIDLRGDLVDRVLLRLAATAPPDVWRERLTRACVPSSGVMMRFHFQSSDVVFGRPQQDHSPVIYSGAATDVRSAPDVFLSHASRPAARDDRAGFPRR